MHIETTTGERHLSLATIDPSASGALTEAEADRQLATLQAELRDLHDLMMAAETHALLIILQGMDASGKDVTIENVHTAFNPQAARVKSFKPRVGEEAKRHFLWRADLVTPMFGEVVTFDRSYYEQAMPEELDGDVSGDALEGRFGHINAFERLLTEEGTIVVKVFLHVGKETQRQRLEERQEEIAAAWKISGADWAKRQQWDAIMAAYETIINACATTHAPWYVVPADHRWHHNAAIAQVLVDRLRPYRSEWERARREVGEENRKEAEAARQGDDA
jgi:PPK2 family polyphosphate:nucleotide phosphotransferase